VGFITRWDLDKTYLRSRFDTLSELVSTALEPAERKRSVPGATELLRELGAAGARVHILSGSPRQMRRKIEAKLRLDGVRWDELTLKPNLSNLVLLRLRALRDQLSYKLPELLAARARDQAGVGRAADAAEVLVGDDSESDAFVYSLYADLCSGAIDAGELERVFVTGRAYAHAQETCRRALSSIRRAPFVHRILIHLDGQTPPSQFAIYGPRLVPFYNYLQAALVLLEAGILQPAAVLGIAAGFSQKHGFSADAIARSYFDLSRRGHASGAAPQALLLALSEAEPGAFSSKQSELRRAIEQMQDAPPAPAAAAPPRVDYAELAAHYGGGKNRRRPGQRF